MLLSSLFCLLLSNALSSRRDTRTLRLDTWRGLETVFESISCRNFLCRKCSHRAIYKTSKSFVEIWTTKYYFPNRKSLREANHVSSWPPLLSHPKTTTTSPISVYTSLSCPIPANFRRVEEEVCSCGRFWCSGVVNEWLRPTDIRRCVHSSSISETPITLFMWGHSFIDHMRAYSDEWCEGFG